MRRAFKNIKEEVSFNYKRLRNLLYTGKDILTIKYKNKIITFLEEAIKNTI